MKYCRYCGMELIDGQCSCYEFQASIGNAPQQRQRNSRKAPFLISYFKPSFASFSSFMSSLRDMTGMSEPNSSFADPYERDIPIVPSCIAPEENEIVVRQYNIAKLRTRLKFMKAEGRLMVTNKRVLFRAAGTSLTGNTLQEHQFNLDEIGGVEIHKDYKFSFLNLFGSLILASLAMTCAIFLLTKMDSANAVKAFGIILGILGIVPTFAVYQRFWLKLFCSGFSMGMLGTAVAATDNNKFLLALLVLSALTVLADMIIVSFVPNLVLKIKTKGAEGAVSIGSQQSLMQRNMNKDYSGFKEIMPWEDTILAINELGTLIDDLQKQGDYAIEKWSV